jgi:hypothetical protein
MKGELPWRLGIILGWVVVLVCATVVVFTAPNSLLLFLAMTLEGHYVGRFLTLSVVLGVVACIMVVASVIILRRMYSIASAHRGGCAFAVAAAVIATPLSWLVLLCLTPLLRLLDEVYPKF